MEETQPEAESLSNEQDSSASTSSKRWTWNKPEGKPKRPLSCYNLFFRNCREKLVAGLPVEAALATGNAADDEQLSRDLAHILSDLANARAHEARLVSSGLPPPKRAHKRLHGRVSFKEMAQTVGDAWKNIDATTRMIYDAAAAIEKKRYVAEVQRWKEEQTLKKNGESVIAASQSAGTPTTEPKKKKAKKSSDASKYAGKPLSMASYCPMPAPARTSHFYSAATRPYLGNLMHQQQRNQQQFQRRQHPQEHPYIPSPTANNLPSATRTTMQTPTLNSGIASRHDNSPSADIVWEYEACIEPTCMPLHVPEVTFGLDGERLTSSPQQYNNMDQSPKEALCTGQTTISAKCLPRSSSLLSLSDVHVPLDFAEEDFHNLSNIFEEGAACPTTAATAAAAFGAKPVAQQPTPLVNDPWSDHEQQGQLHADDMSTTLQPWGGARSA